MSDFLTSAYVLLTEFKLDNTRRGSGGRGNNAPEAGGNASSGSSTNNRRTGFNPNQARGGDGRWVETSAETRSQSGRDNGRDNGTESGYDPDLFDPNSAVGRAYARQQAELSGNAREAPANDSTNNSLFDPDSEAGRAYIRQQVSELYDPDSAIGKMYAKEVAAKETEKAKLQSQIKPIPKDVEVTDSGYSHTTKDGNKLDIELSRGFFPDSNSVDFKINDSFEKASELTPEETNRISIKIAKIMQYEVSTKPDGTRYDTTAYVGKNEPEEYSAVRAYAYEKLAGFTRPYGGEPGNVQFGIVKSGKLVPDIERLREQEEYLEYDPDESETAASEYRKQAQNYRRSRK